MAELQAELQAGGISLNEAATSSKEWSTWIMAWLRAFRGAVWSLAKSLLRSRRITTSEPPIIQMYMNHSSTPNPGPPRQAPSSNNTRDRLRILLCIDHGDSNTRLYQKDMNHKTDMQLFYLLQKEYHRCRKLKSWFTLRSVNKLSLCRVRTWTTAALSAYQPTAGSTR